MPLLINKQSGDAEDLPQTNADIAISTGTHGIPLNDLQGHPVTADSLDQAQHFIGQGYTQPSPEQLQSLKEYTTYNKPDQIAKTFVEHAASSATFGGSTAAEVATGLANPEDVRKRSEYNPGVGAIGDIAGLAATAPLGELGAAGLLSRAGEGAATALGITSKVGSLAAKTAVESALMSAGNEASKAFVKDPTQSAESAITDIGLSGLLGAGVGGALGAVPPLWESLGGTRLGKVLGEVKDRANGLVRGMPTQELEDLVGKSGVEVPAEVKTALGNNPDLRQMFQTLMESSTASGKTAQESFTKFKSDAADKLLGAIGKTPADIDALSEHSAHDAGQALKKSLTDEIKQTVDPLAEQFQGIKDKFSKIEIPNETQAELGDKLSEIGNKFAVSPSSPEYQKIQTIIKELPNVKTLEDLRNFQSVHLGDIASKELWGISGPVRSAMRDAEEGLVMNKLSQEAPGLVGEHQAARKAYGAAMNDLESLNDRLHLGYYGGPKGFLTKLEDMPAEKLLQRLTPKNDAELLNVLSEKFPQTANAVRDEYTNQIAKIAAHRAPQGQSINPNSLFAGLDKWSPELKQFALSPYASTDRIDAIKGLLQAMPSKMNTSGTAKTLDALWSKIPAGVGGIASMLSGHGPVAGFLLGYLGKVASRDIPDAVRLATLKYLGEGKPVSIRGFRAAVDMASAALNGDALVNKATKALFKSGADVLPSRLLPDTKLREKLDKRLQELQSNNGQGLMDIGGETGYYMPDHAAALSATAVRALQYLNGLKPHVPQNGPLDPKDLKPNPIAHAKYERALDIAEQPLIAVRAIKDGRLTGDDVLTVKTIYPNLYNKLNQQITSEMINHISKDGKIPYDQRLSLSMFLGQPLDSTMSPQSILSMQPKPQAPQPQNGGGQTKSGSMKNINKLGLMYQTPSEAAEVRRSRRG